MSAFTELVAEIADLLPELLDLTTQRVGLIGRGPRPVSAQTCWLAEGFRQALLEARLFSACVRVARSRAPVFLGRLVR